MAPSTLALMQDNQPLTNEVCTIRPPIDTVGFFCQSAKAHAVDVSYVRKSKLESQHLCYAEESSILLRGSEQLYYIADITTGPLALFISF